MHITTAQIAIKNDYAQPICCVFQGTLEFSMIDFDQVFKDCSYWPEI